VAGEVRTCRTTLRGATHVVSRVELTADSITSLDQGFDDTGAHKWGPPPGANGHVFVRRLPEVELAVEGDERWWAGVVSESHRMPLGRSSPPFEIDLLGNTAGNQVQPLLLSTKGRYVWSEEPFRLSLRDGKIGVRAGGGDPERRRRRDAPRGGPPRRP
jgi:hypothetical protein